MLSAPTPKVDGDLLHAGSGQIVDRDVVGVLALSLELDALDTGETNGAGAKRGTVERRPDNVVVFIVGGIDAEGLAVVWGAGRWNLPMKSSVSKPCRRRPCHCRRPGSR